MNITEQINKKVGDIAANAAKREAAISIATDALAESLTTKMAELTGIYANSNIEAKTGLRAQVESALDAMAQKAGPAVYDNYTAIMVGNALADFHWNQHSHKYIDRHNTMLKKQGEQNVKSAVEVFAQIHAHGTEVKEVAPLPLLNATAALQEIEQRAGRQYPAKRQK